MENNNIIYLSTTEIAEAIRSAQLSAEEIVKAHLDQIEKHNATINAVVTLDVEGALKRAKEADAALAKGDNWGPLHGVPFTLKDAISTAGMRTTIGFPPLAEYVPQEDSTVATRLKAAGGILMGKTNVQMLLGDSLQTTNPIFGRTNNPWNPEYVPGGSSGGAAAALTAGMTPFEVGSDLAGSLRIPANFCGLFGLKPTENRIPLTGFFPNPQGLPRSIRIMSCLGPLARTLEDLELLFSILAGPDGHDTEIAPVPVEAEKLSELNFKRLRVAFAPTFPGLPISAQNRKVIEETAVKIKTAGAIVEEVKLPERNFSEDLGRAGELIGLITGAFQPQEENKAEEPVPFTQYLIALEERDKAINAWEQFFNKWDVLLCPVAMTNAFKHQEQGKPLPVDGKPEQYWAANTYATLFNYTGHPATALPYKLDEKGMPTGFQLVSKRFLDNRLLTITKAIAVITGGFQRPPGY